MKVTMWSLYCINVEGKNSYDPVYKYTVLPAHSVDMLCLSYSLLFILFV